MAKKKCDYTPDEWAVVLEKNRERNRRYLAKRDPDVLRRRYDASIKWREANKDIVKAKCAKRARLWYEQHREYATAANRDRRNAKIEKVRESDRAKYRRNAAYYKAKAREREMLMPRRSLGGAYKKEILAIYRKARQMTIETGVQHHVDHIIPLHGQTISGLHVPKNLRVITAEENRRKYNHYYKELAHG